MGIDAGYYTDIAPDPLDEELGPIRRTLRSLCGRPEPKESKLFDGFLDVHHGLLVGPCDAGAISEAEEAGRHLIEKIGVSGEDSFDCTYEEWAGLFREEVRRVVSAGSPESMRLKVVLSRQQRAEANRARESGGPLVLDGVHRIELREGGWIVVGSYGSVLMDIEKSEWVHTDQDPDMPPLKFPTPEEALVGYLRGEVIATARSERYEAAIGRLGRE